MIPAASPESPLFPAIPDTALFWARWVPRLILFSASLVILARLAAPFEVGKDQTYQLEGALRMSAGQGIVSTGNMRPSDPDITPAPVPVPLTQWPPGFSIAIAALVGCGFSLTASLKLLFALAAAAGWSGWAFVCGKLFAAIPATGSSRILRSVPLIAAALLPIFYTPLWSGTDILLWAGVPWIVPLTNRPAGSPGSYGAAVAAGILICVLFTFRYASAFLGIAAGGIIFCAVQPRWMELLKRYLALGLSSLLLTVPVVLFMRTGTVPLADMYDNRTKTSEIISAAKGAHHAGKLIFAGPFLETMLSRVNWPPLVYAASILAVAVILIAPVLRWRAGGRGKDDITLALLLLPAALIVFLLVVSRGFYLGVPRYYDPVLLCWVLACVSLSSSRRTAVAWGARAVLAVFLTNLCGVTPLMAAMESHRPRIIRTVLGYTPSKAANLNATSAPVVFPDFGRLYSNKEDTKTRMAALFQQYPEALFLVESYTLYIFDGFPGGPQPGSQIRPFPPERYLASAFSSIDRKVFMVLDFNEKEPKPREWIGKVVYRNQWENTVISEIQIRAGQRVLDAARAMPRSEN
mgnify:CR=1 FL=1